MGFHSGSKGKLRGENADGQWKRVPDIRGGILVVASTM